MSNGQSQNPPRQNNPRPVERSQQQTQAPQPASRQDAGEQVQRQAEAQAAPRPAPADLSAISVPEAAPKTGQQPAFKAGQTQVTLGRAGEHNLSVEWIDVNLATYLSARFNIKTATENTLEVQVEQNAYRKAYTGSGSISTTVVPGAPVGTIGKLTARDTTTGEMLEVPWTWYNMGGRSRGLWETIKQLIWKSGA